MKGLSCVILAAGLGKRMRSSRAKVLHPLGGRPIILHVLDEVEKLRPDLSVLVVGRQAKEVLRVTSGRSVVPALQKMPLGTGHAALQAARVLGRTRNRILILNGDTPLIRKETLGALIRYHGREKSTVTLLTARMPNPSGYGRIIRGSEGRVDRIVEEKDATPIEREMNEVNTGTYVVNAPFLRKALLKIRKGNAQGEYYLTDLVAIAAGEGERVAALTVSDEEEVRGVNTRADLAACERTLRFRRLAACLARGVTVLDPTTTYVGEDVRIGRDTVLHPFVTLEGRTRIGRDCIVRSHTRIRDSVLADGVTVKDACVIEESRLGRGAVAGPFAHLRPGTVLDSGARVGNFVEIKKSRIGAASKANHLSYIGDAAVGRHVNIGAGTITCNFDGSAKHRTIIGDEVFVGSDTQLVAPVRVGRGAVVAAGSTITRNVPQNALAIARIPQTNKPGYTKQRRKTGKKRL